MACHFKITFSLEKDDVKHLDSANSHLKYYHNVLIFYQTQLTEKLFV